MLFFSLSFCMVIQCPLYFVVVYVYAASCRPTLRHVAPFMVVTFFYTLLSLLAAILFHVIQSLFIVTLSRYFTVFIYVTHIDSCSLF